MNQRKHPPYGINFAAGLLMLIGWGGLYYLVKNIDPTAGPRWYFFILLYLAMVGTTLPIIRFINMRLSDHVSDGIVLRQSLWVALYVTIAAWLQILRFFGIFVGVLLAFAFIALEVFLRVRENLQYEE
jgi:hypothetical protein